MAKRPGETFEPNPEPGTLVRRSILAEEGKDTQVQYGIDPLQCDDDGRFPKRSGRDLMCSILNRLKVLRTA